MCRLQCNPSEFPIRPETADSKTIIVVTTDWLLASYISCIVRFHERYESQHHHVFHTQYLMILMYSHLYIYIYIFICACEKNWGDSQSMLGSWAFDRTFWWLSNAMCFFKGRGNPGNGQFGQPQKVQSWVSAKWRFVENQDIMVYRASFLYVNQVSTVFISFHRFHVILFPKLSYLNDLAPFGSIWYFGIWTAFAACHPHFQLAWQTWNLRDAALQKLAMDLQNGEHRWHGCNFGMEAEHWWISTDVTLWQRPSWRANNHLIVIR